MIALIVVLYADAVLGRGCNEHDIAGLQASMKRWRAETVLPLRRLRRALKQPPREFPREETEALRGLIKNAELRAEQIQLALAGQWLLERPPHVGLKLEQAVALLARAPGESSDMAGLFARIVAAGRDAARR